MPEISRFFGIIIRMYFHDHAAAHPAELRQDWQRAQAGEVLAPIDPLE